MLGWGGYWGWDPVENASLLPWLTGTAFIHSVIVQERRGMLRVWNLSLVLATFCLTILGTFLTRSGVVNSVHAFTQSSIGPWLLGFLAVVVVTCIGLDRVAGRQAARAGSHRLAGLARSGVPGQQPPLHRPRVRRAPRARSSRCVAEAVRGNQLSVGEPYFARMTTPIGLALLFLMAVAPALPWRAASGDVLRRRLLVPAYAGVLVMLVTVVFLTRIAGDGARVRSGDVRGRRDHPRDGVRGAEPPRRGSRRLVPLVRRHRARQPAPLRRVRRAHRCHLDRGRARIGRCVRYQGGGAPATRRIGRSSGGTRCSSSTPGPRRTGQKTSVSADLALSKGGRDLGTYAPAVSTFPNSNTAIGTPSVRTGIIEDVYLTIVSSPNEQGRITVGDRGQLDDALDLVWVAA